MITQPWQDDRLLMNGKYIGCVTKKNADLIMLMQEVLVQLAKGPKDRPDFILHLTAKTILKDLG